MKSSPSADDAGQDDHTKDTGELGSEIMVSLEELMDDLTSGRITAAQSKERNKLISKRMAIYKARVKEERQRMREARG